MRNLQACNTKHPLTIHCKRATLRPVTGLGWRCKSKAALPAVQVCVCTQRTCMASCGSAGALPVWSNAPDLSTASVLSANVLTQCACPLSVRTSLPSAALHTLMQQSLLLL